MLKLGVKALNNASREVVVKLLKRQGAELVKRETHDPEGSTGTILVATVTDIPLE